MAYTELLSRIERREAVVGIMGLGYVGLPLAVELARSGYRTLGFDISEGVVRGINGGRSHVQDVSSEVLGAFVGEGLLSATDDMTRMGECDAICICVPTPLNKIKDPDLSFVAAAAEAIAAQLRPGQMVILESTTYPGTTRDVVLPILERGGLKVGENLFVCFSPERVDPGNPVWHTRNTPKVIGGITPRCLEAGVALYGGVFDTLVPVESAEAAELVKVYENTFRMINIALANELAQACDRLGVNVWEVIDAAATKPFGFMKFTPGPGLGGHCIPLDPHYLSWKMRTLAFKTRMIELASEINAEMPGFVVGKVADALNDDGKAVRGSRVLVLGVAYKKDIDDLRESPALEILRLLQEKGADVQYHDPFCGAIRDDGHTPLRNLPLLSQELTDEALAGADVVVVVTDHTAVDYDRVAERARVVVDTRGVVRPAGRGGARIVGLSGVARGPERVRVPVLVG
ncbi:nucleotide sugar dehydrogenase [Longimicrobium terrae]|uniref:UDP-N-acetyl-D-glucosamine dehydrogenase n=1 Tax=Longimicrobium terrae TaxID=1639882 RepID=A0A841GUH1_9BACT|nr:nucleotide sugar dehydrogenase [Longimicrobium terrae]MBB4634487.1 UDP-N-acetyl-D-glucosamine dehydrogenase [Longimicrobium terrae]MBB6068623.1 UDP-N-acetyl-D-glucosamine dehydrogenase [Longimicrobium terrae]NNC27809.1 nucleotide sugar dehydrogenase [Longimicrobium terrae]